MTGWWRRCIRLNGWLICTLSFAWTALAQPFEYNPPGQLVEGSGQGRVDEQVYAPNMRFPIEEAPAYANSQVWGVGGSQGPAGSQCDARNFSYPWWDNYCENRTHMMPFCPTGTGHQGQDIRPASCEDKRYWAVVAESGQVATIGDYWVYIASDSGNFHGYLHLDPQSLTVAVGDRVQPGQRLGLISNWFNGTPTTIHLHYEILQRINGSDPIHMPTYMSLVKSYETLLDSPGMQAPTDPPCMLLPADGGILDNQSDCFQRFGPDRTWRVVEDEGYDGDFIWTYAWVNPTPSNWVRWQLAFQESGRYRIESHVVPDYAQSRRTPYSIKHGDQESEVRIDLTTDAPWVLIGEFDFEAGANQWVDQFDNTGENRDLELKIMADALRITRVNEIPSSMDDTDPAPMSGGTAELDEAPAMPANVGGEASTTDETSDDEQTSMNSDMARDEDVERPPLVQTLPKPSEQQGGGRMMVFSLADEGYGGASGCGCSHLADAPPSELGWLMLIWVCRPRRRKQHSGCTISRADQPPDGLD